MSKIGFIGLGVMGSPMAARLVAAGHTVTGFSRSKASRRLAEIAGISTVDTLHDAVKDAELVITMLPDGPDVESVVLGANGILSSLPPSCDYIDMSTIAPDTARRLAERIHEQGHSMLDAPVSGGESGAKAGSLSIMVGGDSSTLERWRKILSSLGTTIVLVGDSGAGQVVKAANQLVVAGHLQMLAEAITFLEAQNADVGVAMSVIAKGLGGSTVIDRKTASVLEDNYAPGFRIELHHKDLGIVLAAARSTGAVVPVTALISQLIQSVVTRGDGALDHSALVKLAREFNGGVRK